MRIYLRCLIVCAICALMFALPVSTNHRSTSLAFHSVAQAFPFSSAAGQDNGAQENDRTETQDGANSDGENSSSVDEAELPTFYLIRDNGELVPYFQIPFEEFEEIYRAYRGMGQAEQPISYSIGQAEIEGRIENDAAYLDLQLSIRAAIDGWIRVPLRLEQCSLRAPQSQVGDEVAFLSVEEDGEGLVCWIQGVQGEETTLNLKLVRMLESDGPHSRLSINLPPAVFCKLELTVPIEDAFGMPNDESTLQTIERLDGGQTKFSVLGRTTGGFDFRFGQREQSVIPDRRLIASSETQIVIESDRQAIWQTTLDVESTDGNVDQFELRLPIDVVLDATETPAYRIEPLEPMDLAPIESADASIDDQSGGDSDSQDSTTDRNRQRVRIQFLNPSRRVEQVVLSGRIRWPDSAPQQIEIVEVIDSIRHQGRIDLFATGREWLVDWETTGDLIRSSNPINVGRSDTVVGGYSFAEQSGGLVVSVGRQPTRLDVEPVVALTASRTLVELDAIFHASLSGMPTNRIVLDLDQWELDTVIGNEMVRAFERVSADQNVWTIELDPDRAEEQVTFDIRVLAHIRIDSSATQFLTRLPRLQNAVTLPTTLLVRQEESLSIHPDRAALLPVQLSAVPDWYPEDEYSLPDVAYRGMLTSDSPSIAFDLSIRPQTVSHRMEIQATLTDQGIGIQTEIDFDVKNQALRSLSLLVPRRLLEQSDVIVQISDMDWIWTYSDLDATDPTSLVSLEMDLGDGLIGQHRATVEYQLPPFEVSAPTPTNQGDSSRGDQLLIPIAQPLFGSPVPRSSGFPLPIMTPMEWIAYKFGDPLQHRMLSIDFSHELSLDIEPGDQRWHSTGVSERDGRIDSGFTSSQPHPNGELEFFVKNLRRRVGSEISIEKRWIQTQLTKSERQDRAVFQLHTNQPTMRIEIPSGATLGRVAVNDVSIRNPRVEEVDGRSIVVIATDDDIERSQTIELWYRFRDSRFEVDDLELVWPEIERNEWVERSYWQVILPRDEHLVWFGASLMPEHDWRYGPLFFERRTRLTQEELEDWIGVSHQATAERGGNVYLFSSFGKNVSARVAMTSRRLLLFVGCGSFFLIGLMVIYVRWTRNPVVVMFAGLAILAFSVVQVELAVLAAQVAMITGVFVFLAMLLRAAFVDHRPAARTIPVAQRESQSTATRLMDSREQPDREAVTEMVAVSSSHGESS